MGGFDCFTVIFLAVQTIFSNFAKNMQNFIYML